MSKGKHSEAQIIGVLKQVVTCPPDPSNIVTEFDPDSICRFAFI